MLLRTVTGYARNGRAIAGKSKMGTAVAVAGSPWTTTYSYDAWGNLLQKSTSGPGEPSMGPLTVDVHNHVNPSSYTYDAAGNLTFDGVNHLNFDAENRATPSSGPYTYSYDGDDHRVEKNNAGSITYYWYDDNFNVISTTGALTRDYVYFNGRRIAYFAPSSGNQHYYWSDHLGSERTMSNSSGTTNEWDGDYYPFGGSHVYNPSLENYFRFTDDQYDPELGDNYFENREQSYVLGRFFSPDPIPGGTSNPQSWNRYAYAMNRPTVMTDQSGLCPECIFSGIPGVGPIIAAAGAVFDLFEIFGHHGPSFHPNGPPFGRSGAGQDSGPLQGETLGLPNSLRLPRPSLAGLVVPIDSGCEFGSCGITLGFQNPEYAKYRRETLAAGDFPLDEGAWNILQQVGKKAAPIANPCFYASWAVGAAVLGGGVYAAANAGEITATVSENSTSIFHKISTWLYRRSLRAGPTVSMMITSGKETCSRF